MKEFGEFMLGLILIITGIMLGGFVLQLLWGWLVVPTFDVKSITLAQAIGIKIFVSFFEVNETDKTEGDVIDKLFRAYGKLIGHCIVYILFGYIVSLFI